MADEDGENGGRDDLPEDLDDIRRGVEEANEHIDEAFDRVGDAVDGARDDITERIDDAETRVQEGVGGVADGLDDLREEVQHQGERTRDRMDDQHASTRGAVSDEAGTTRDRLTDEHGRTQDMVDDLGDTVRDQGQQTRDVVETTAGQTMGTVQEEGAETRARVADVGDDVAALDGKLDRLTEEAIQDLLDEKDARREDNEELFERLVEMADTEYSPEQFDRIMDEMRRKDHKHNSDLAAVITHLVGDEFDHSAYQHWTGTTGQSYGLDVNTVDMADAQDVRNVLSYQGETGDFDVLSDPFDGVNAWEDKAGYGSVLRHTWTRLVDEVATYVAEQDARGADISGEVQETVLTYLEESGAALESVADEASHGGQPDRELAVLQHFDYAARRVDQHLSAGEYEQAAAALDAAYDTEQVADVLNGDIEVGA